MGDEFFFNNAINKSQHSKVKSGNIKSNNSTLNQAFLNKKDEFYTMYEDVEKEMNCHKGQFAGKTVLCNCDDPFESAFFRFFVLKFADYGIRSLITTCYAHSSFAGKEYPIEGGTGAYKSVVREVPDSSLVLPDGSLDIKALFAMRSNSLEYLEGDGDFRSPECEAILNEADIVVTNPPFSLFREYVAQLMAYDKKFIIIGSMNAVGYKEVFPLIRDNKIWLGYGFQGGNAYFSIPNTQRTDYAAGVYDQKTGLVKFRNCTWYTNIDHDKRHEELILFKSYNPTDYPHYANYDAINVSKTAEIPFDYFGLMGVPITFMEKYNPAQFEILGLAHGLLSHDLNIKPIGKEWCDLYFSQGNKGHYSPSMCELVAVIDGKAVSYYNRLIIRRKEQTT